MDYVSLLVKTSLKNLILSVDAKNDLSASVHPSPTWSTCRFLISPRFMSEAAILLINPLRTSNAREVRLWEVGPIGKHAPGDRQGNGAAEADGERGAW